MKNLWRGFFFLALLIMLAKLHGKNHPAADTPEVAIALEVDNVVVTHAVHRVGINLGQRTSWGSQQYSTNILMNPGFEGQVDRILVVVSEAEGDSFHDEAGLGHPDDYWAEAEYDIRTGKAAGERGVIKRSLYSGNNGAPQYFSYGPLPPLEVNDVLVLTKLSRPAPGTFWLANDDAIVGFDPYQKRPDSPGSQSIRLTPTGTTAAEVNFLVDNRLTYAGKMLPVNGPWHFSVWAKAQRPNTHLEVAFQRKNSGRLFFSEILPLTPDWQEYNIDFNGNDQGPVGALELKFTASEEGSAVWLDDAWLGPRQQQPSTFREEVIEVLQKIKPSFIREFASLSDTWENRVAVPFGRKPWTFYLSDGRQEKIYNYSLPDLLQLCTLVKANPWIIIPPTYSDYELRKMGEFLAKNASMDRFSEVILEFGSENWNWLHRPAAIPYYQVHGEVAKRAFEKISESIGKKVNVRYLVNGQYTAPLNSLNFLDYTPNADGIAIAPYFFNTLQRGTPDLKAMELLFQDDSGLLSEIAEEVQAKGKMLAVSELNLHTTRGDAKAYERDRIVAGAVSGSALAKRILDCLFAGADPVMVYTLAQHDTATWDTAGLVKLWGVVRDFGPPPIMRPTGLAVTMLNKVVGGEMHRINTITTPFQEPQKMTMAAFSHNTLWAAAIVSESPNTLELELQFPDDDRSLPGTLMILDAEAPFDTNELKEDVKIVQTTLEVQGRVARFSIPPWGVAVLE